MYQQTKVVVTASRAARLTVGAALVGLAWTWPTGAAGQAVVEVQVVPVSVTLEVGERREILASAYDSQGDNIATAQFMWMSGNRGVVRIETDPNIPGIAVLVGVAPGIASVEAATGGRRGFAAVQVTAHGAAGAARAPGRSMATVLQINPASVFLLPSEGARLTPVFLRDDGAAAVGAPVRWRSLRADVATVTPQGAVVGVSPGQGVVEATTTSGLLARVPVEVARTSFAFNRDVLTLSPGQLDTIRIAVPEQNHRLLSPRRLVWRSTNDAVVRVSPLGVATGVGPGRAQIVASGFGLVSRLPVTVHRAVDVLEVAPKASAGTVGIPLGGTRAFSVRAMASDDTPIPEASLTWRISNPAVATLDPATGMVTGRSLGRAELTVRGPGPGLEVTWGLDVVAGGLEFESDAVGVGLRERRRLRAWFLDARGVRVSEAAGIDWRTSDDRVLSVDAVGRLVPVALGEVDVVASTPWGAADTARVYVQGDVLVTSTRSGTADLYSFDPRRPEVLYRVTDFPGNELSGEYSPDGSKIVYVSDAGSSLDVLVVDAGGTAPVGMAASFAQESSPTWSPDGRQIVYESDEGGTLQIWIMNADGSHKRQLTEDGSPNIQPAVSPDGRTIAFTSARGGNYDIYLMNLDGSEQRSFTNTPSNETQPQWIGNDALAFISETRSRKRITRVVTRMELGRQTTALTPDGLAVSDFAIAPSGDLLAAVVSADGAKGTLERRLYLIPLTAGGMPPVEVPRAADADHLITPSFRR